MRYSSVAFAAVVNKAWPSGIFRHIMRAAVPPVPGDLEVEITHRLLVGNNTVIILFVLIVVQVSRGRRSQRRRRCPCRSIISISIAYNLLVGVDGNLKIGIGHAADETDPARIVQDVGQIRERLVLIRIVVDCLAAGMRCFQCPTSCVRSCRQRSSSVFPASRPVRSSADRSS